MRKRALIGCILQRAAVETTTFNGCLLTRSVDRAHVVLPQQSQWQLSPGTTGHSVREGSHVRAQTELRIMALTL